MIPNRLPQHLLVIDDSELQRQFMAELCSDMGIPNVLQAVDGFDAVAQLKTNPQIEAIILDLEMPGMDGVEVLHELARLQLDPAVIVASARESVLLNVVESMGKSLGLRLLGVLQKPVLFEQLASSLSRFSVVQQRAEHNESQMPGPQLDEQDIQRALRESEFVAYFQPKVSLLDGQLKGVEALIRWQHPQHGLLAPGQFIELIERSPYISEVTLQMLDMSLQHCRRWHDAGLPLSFSINVSARSLADSKLADAIIERVAASGIPTQHVILEITESAIMVDLGITLGTLARLRLKGFGLSVDDYGTGFSCMLQLSRVPCSELKVDRAFVNGASQSLHLRILLESALDIARKLNLHVVAEGVETREDWLLLRNLGCSEAQGYFVAKPMPGDALLPWWRANRERVQLLGMAVE
ncbi:EAL domain-containing response regulator [Aquipseudomonas guryensis]|uniref:EAL domain-containing response regulator n=1 Tax=Aquipseudomonas guryensis TaxID=2759165 RepID=A0A7W4DD52_9GAMM|nr:EAL domain-containing response regulator [Pseudomonas guryensis]MBB1520341.1 EAL domain-containing response regulator [Pseudomonas guryensis]